MGLLKRLTRSSTVEAPDQTLPPPLDALEVSDITSKPVRALEVNKPETEAQKLEREVREFHAKLLRFQQTRAEARALYNSPSNLVYLPEITSLKSAVDAIQNESTRANKPHVIEIIGFQRPRGSRVSKRKESAVSQYEMGDNHALVRTTFEAKQLYEAEQALARLDSFETNYFYRLLNALPNSSSAQILLGVRFKKGEHMDALAKIGTTEGQQAAKAELDAAYKVSPRLLRPSRYASSQEGNRPGMLDEASEASRFVGGAVRLFMKSEAFQEYLANFPTQDLETLQQFIESQQKQRAFLEKKTNVAKLPEKGILNTPAQTPEDIALSQLTKECNDIASAYQGDLKLFVLLAIPERLIVPLNRLLETASAPNSGNPDVILLGQFLTDPEPQEIEKLTFHNFSETILKVIALVHGDEKKGPSIQPSDDDREKPPAGTSPLHPQKPASTERTNMDFYPTDLPAALEKFTGLIREHNGTSGGEFVLHTADKELLKKSLNFYVLAVRDELPTCSYIPFINAMAKIENVNKAGKIDSITLPTFPDTVRMVEGCVRVIQNDQKEKALSVIDTITPERLNQVCEQFIVDSYEELGLGKKEDFNLFDFSSKFENMRYVVGFSYQVAGEKEWSTWKMDVLVSNKGVLQIDPQSVLFSALREKKIRWRGSPNKLTQGPIIVDPGELEKFPATVGIMKALKKGFGTDHTAFFFTQKGEIRRWTPKANQSEKPPAADETEARGEKRILIGESTPLVVSLLKAMKIPEDAIIGEAPKFTTSENTFEWKLNFAYKLPDGNVEFVGVMYPMTGRESRTGGEGLRVSFALKCTPSELKGKINESQMLARVNQELDNWLAGNKSDAHHAGINKDVLILRPVEAVKAEIHQSRLTEVERASIELGNQLAAFYFEQWPNVLPLLKQAKPVSLEPTTAGLRIFLEGQAMIRESAEEEQRTLQTKVNPDHFRQLIIEQILNQLLQAGKITQIIRKTELSV